MIPFIYRWVCTSVYWPWLAGVVAGLLIRGNLMRCPNDLQQRPAADKRSSCITVIKLFYITVSKLFRPFIIAQQAVSWVDFVGEVSLKSRRVIRFS